MIRPLAASRLLTCLLLFAFFIAPARAEFKGGRYLDDGKTFSMRFNVGRLDGLDGRVEETKRAGTAEVTDEGRFLETYTFDELGFDDSYSTLGVELEKRWKWVTAQLDLKYANVDADARARRVYAIGVEEVSFEGETYEYMLIPDGREFEAEMDTLIVDAKLKITPFHYESSERWVSFSPWLLVGVFAMGGDFTIDAGEPEGVTTYEIDPYPYVVGGRGEGTVGGVLPEIGLGAELRLGLWEMNADRAELVFQAEYAWLDLAANTGDFGVSARNEKNVDTTFHNMEVRGQLELPFSDATDFVVGGGMKTIDIEASVTADRLEPGETTTEKYDKEGEIEMTSYFAFAGLKF